MCDIISNYFILFSLLEKENYVPVYNSASVSKSVSNEQLLDVGMKILEQYPFDEMIWRPKINFTTCFYYYYISTIIEQVFPAIFFDAFLDLIGKPHKYENVYNYYSCVSRIRKYYYCTKNCFRVNLSVVSCRH